MVQFFPVFIGSKNKNTFTMKIRKIKRILSIFIFEGKTLSSGRLEIPTTIRIQVSKVLEKDFNFPFCNNNNNNNKNALKTINTYPAWKHICRQLNEKKKVDTFEETPI